MGCLVVHDICRTKGKDPETRTSCVWSRMNLLLYLKFEAFRSLSGPSSGMVLGLILLGFTPEKLDDVRCQLTIVSYSRMSVMTDVGCDSEQEAGTSGVIIRWKSGEIFVFIVGSSVLC